MSVPTRRNVLFTIVIAAGAAISGCSELQPTSPLLSDRAQRNVVDDARPTAPLLGGLHGSHFTVDDLRATFLPIAGSAGSYLTGYSEIGDHFQAAIGTTPIAGFPLAGPSYLVVSSGDARQVGADASYDRTCGLHRDCGGIMLRMQVPADAGSLRFSYRFFSGEAPWSLFNDQFRAVLLLPGQPSIPLALANVHTEAIGLPTAPWWGPIRKVAVDIVPYRGQEIALVLQAADSVDNVVASGAVIDSIRIESSTVAPAPNLPPQITSYTLSGLPAFEGAPVHFNATAFHPNGQPVTFTWHFGDGSTALGASVSHVYLNDGIYHGLITVSAGQLSTTLPLQSISVFNVAPVVQLSTPAFVTWSGAAAEAVIQVSFVDPGPFDTHTASINCDDGAGPVQLGTVTSPFTHTCRYSSLGSKLVQVVVTDNDGPPVPVFRTIGVQYAFSGFQRPVYDLPTINDVRAGAAIPIKFGLGGDRGLEILDGMPRSRTVSCDEPPVPAPAEPVSPAGGSGLTYDAAADQYTFVWKTDRAWAGTCRDFQLRLNDVTLWYARFRFAN